MGQAIEVRTELTADEVRQLARGVPERAQALRLIAIAAVLDGASRKDAAKTCLMSARSLYVWISRFNTEGLGGLVDKRRSGRPPKLNDEQRAQVLQWVGEGPDRQWLGIVRWRLQDLCGEIKRCFGIELSEDAIGALLKRGGFSHISARPQHPRQDTEIMEDFKKNLAQGWRNRRPNNRAGR